MNWNNKKISIIESTLREGEQFANAFFTTSQKIKIAKQLDSFGVDYIELTSPVASKRSLSDCKQITQLGLKSKILTHTRCCLDDATVAVECGVDGINLVIGTSSYLRKFSHGKSIKQIIQDATQVIKFVQNKGLEVRFSTEDSFRSNLNDLLTIYKHVSDLGVNRVGIADTVGCATPLQVHSLVSKVREIVNCDIECHFHNDTGCAIANSFVALQAGATHIDTSVLGIGERNGITPLGGLIALLYTQPKLQQYIKNKYQLTMLKSIENYISSIIGVEIPFNNYITGFCAFTHKAGIHAKAVLNNPETYEIINPTDFGMTRCVPIGHQLVGWNTIKQRAEQLNLKLSDQSIKKLTQKIKQLADLKPLSLDEIDSLLAMT